MTPQMHAVLENIQSRNLNISNRNKKTKISVGSKQQNSNISNQTSLKVQETKISVENKQQNSNISNQMSVQVQERKGEHRNIRYKDGSEQRKWHRGNQKRVVHTSKNITSNYITIIIIYI